MIAIVATSEPTTAASGCLPQPTQLDGEQLFQRYYERMHCVARRFLASEHDRADAVQDTFLAVLKSQDKFDGRSSVWTWMYRILVNNCLMRLRNRSRSSCLHLDALLSDLELAASQPQHPCDDAVDPAAHLVHEESRTLLYAALDRLPAKDRAIIRLRDLEQLNTDQTAAALDISPGAVKTRLHRARKSLRSLIAP